MEQFLSEIRLFSFDFAPAGWAKCEGQTLAINQNQALFSLLGTIYGGDGRTTFALPDLRGRVLLNSGRGLPSYMTGGSAAVALTTAQLPKHNHEAFASSKEHNINTPSNNFWASDIGYAKDPTSSMNTGSIANTGSNRPHDNMSPFLSMNYCISLTGNYPNTGTENEDFAGTIKPFCNNIRPSNWLPCDGTEYSTLRFPRLFAVIGYTYGGSNDKFRVPDINGHVMIGYGKGEGLTDYKPGEKGGAAEVTLTKKQLPKHSHQANAGTNSNAQRADNNFWSNPGGRPAANFYASEKGKGVTMHANAIQESGEAKPHSNLMPYMTMPLFISTEGIVPHYA